METTHQDRPAATQLGRALPELLQEVGAAAVLGLAGALALLWLFGWLADEVFGQEFTRLDTGLALAIHSWANPALDTFFGFFSLLGGVGGTILITAAAFAFLTWHHHYHHAWRLLLAVLGGVVLSEALKFVFQRPRPALWPGAGPPVAGFGFPSGHATVALCLFGMLLWLGLHHWPPHPARFGWAALMVAVILLIGLSRIYLGAHYPTDVLAGFLAGGFWLVMLITGSHILARLRRPAAA